MNRQMLRVTYTQVAPPSAPLPGTRRVLVLLLNQADCGDRDSEMVTRIIRLSHLSLHVIVEITELVHWLLEVRNSQHGSM